MNIRPRPGKLLSDNQQSPPTQARFARAYFLPWGCSCPRLTSRGLGAAKEHPSHAMCASRRDAVFAAVEAYNRTHPAAPLPRPAARLLAVMFATEDVCCLSQQALVAEGFGKIAARGAARPGRGGLRVEAGGHVACPGHLPASGAGRQCHDPPPPREGVRPRPRRAAGPQRQGPHPGLRPRLGRPTPPAGPTQGPDHPRLPGGAGGPAMGLPQRPLRLLLPELRDDRRQGGVRPQHRCRGAEGPGVGRRADLAEPDHQDPRPRARPVRPLGEPLAGDPHQQCLRVPRSAAASRGGSRFQVRKSDRNTESRSY